MDERGEWIAGNVSHQHVWTYKFATGMEMLRERRLKVFKGRDGETLLPGLPDSLVEDHILPRILADCDAMDALEESKRNPALDVLRAVRVASKRWCHLIT